MPRRVLGRALSVFAAAIVAAASARAEAPLLVFPPIDPQALVERDAAAERIGSPGPLQFAEPIEMLATPRTDGAWTTLPDGRRSWELAIQVPAATDLNFGFRRFDLPDGATLEIRSEDGLTVLGPYGPGDGAEGQLWTPIVRGDRATLALRMPGSARDPILELGQVGAGYRDVGGPVPLSDVCNIDVACPEGVPWSDEIRSSVRYSINGRAFCSGTLIRDVPRTWRPFVLSANHCGVSAGSAPTIVAYWNYQASTCGGARDGLANAVTQSGAQFRAALRDSDMALFELSDPPVAGSNAWWAGWDRSDVAPASAVAIHHPNWDEKAISFDDDPLTRGENCIDTPGRYPDTHWYVGDYENGTTEAGSSGSAIFDAASHLIVGTLSGGLASCASVLNGDPNDDFDCWGRFGRHWDMGTTAAERLRDWLDPASTGATTVPGGAPGTTPDISLDSLSFTDACSLGLGDGNGLAEPGETITIVPRLVALGGSFTNVRGVLDTTATGVTLVDANATWPDLADGATAPSDAPHLRATIATNAACGTMLDFTLRITAAEGGPFDVPITIRVGDPPPRPNVPVPIGDLTTTESTMIVTKDVTIASLDVRVSLAHSYVGDLLLALRSPANTTVVLLDRPGHPAVGGGCPDDDLDVTFSASSSFDLETHCAGTRPWYEGFALPLQSLAAFNGESTAGTWRLFVQDQGTGDLGTILDWELLATPALGTECLACVACPGQRVGETVPDVLRLRKGPGGSAILTLPSVASSCASGLQVRMSPRVRPTTGAGSFPTDPPFADVTAQDADGGPEFRHVPPAGTQFYLVVEDLAGSPGPSGSYGR
jgi:subtilisin-like proprotein convertase family protein